MIRTMNIAVETDFENRKATFRITGAPGTGKSNLADFLNHVLKEHGARVRHFDESRWIKAIKAQSAGETLAPSHDFFDFNIDLKVEQHMRTPRRRAA